MYKYILSSIAFRSLFDGLATGSLIGKWRPRLAAMVSLIVSIASSVFDGVAGVLIVGL